MSKFYDKHSSGNDDSLSAFLDGEATHADIDALLASDRQTLASQVDRYHRIHQAIQPEQTLLIDDAGSFLDQIHRKLDEGKQDTNVVAFPTQSQALTKPEKLEQVTLPNMASRSSLSKRSVFSGLAVAASVAFAVVLGGNVLLQGDSTAQTPVFAATPPVQQMPTEPFSALSAEEALQNNERLQNYLRQHAQQASMTVGQGMIPMARVVGYPQGKPQ
ncbi:MAG: sigma-E factor negative regulatory protein [Marinomonas atlantica]|nr:sigma-E factor negative regulatory protein [Marinomonas atlantica]